MRYLPCLFAAALLTVAACAPKQMAEAPINVIFETDKNLFWSLDGEKQVGNRIVHIRNLHSVLTIFN